MNQLESDDAAWVRAKIEERGMTEEIEAEAQRRIAGRRDVMGDAAVRGGVAAGLFLIAGGILYAFGAYWWAYLIAAVFAVVFSK